MNYIVIDLEWNQSPLGKKYEEENCPFEIIEIGAVKLDENRNFLDTFQCIIKPQVYKRLFSLTQEIVRIDKEELEEGIPFSEAVKSFFLWCGDDYRFCTWGSMDLVELQRNMKYYHINKIITKPFFYCDVQKLFSLQTEGKKNPRTLEYAVEYFQLDKEGAFHRALYDAEYTARVFQKLDLALVERLYSIDCYCNPKKKEDQIYIKYETYSKFISREFSVKEEIFNDKELKRLVCFMCDQPAVKKINWFSNNPKNYYALGKCKEHGYLKGRIQINKSADTRKPFAIKIVSKINKESAQGIALHYKEIEIKKQEKRIRNK